MPLVNAEDLLKHARDVGYRVPAFELSSLDHIVPVIEAVERAAAPAILSFDGETGRSLVPALAAATAVAHTAAVPLVIEARVAADGEAVARAIRGGANGILLCPQAGAGQDRIEAAMQIGRPTGVPLFVTRDAAMAVDARYRCRLPADRETPCAGIERGIAESGARGLATQALSACRPWREVEHLVIYNVGENHDARFVEETMARGRILLGAIPGVRQVLTGRALRNDARYRYCWLVRFACPAVVDSYRVHPDHVAFADSEFRPVASDRLGIDFELLE